MASPQTIRREYLMRDELPLFCQIHDHGHVALEDYMGDDLSIVNAARVSFNDHEDEMTEKNKGLINFLMRERHGTPFEMVEFKFNVKAPIFVFREWHRHRVASINEWSARYSEMKEEFYIPPKDYWRKQVGKPGNYSFEPIEDPVFIETAQSQMLAECRSNFALYKSLMDQDVAKEQARVHLPLNLYSRMIWKTNLRGLLNFLSLRNSPHAMREIRDYAEMMEGLAFLVVPEAIEAFQRNNRTCP